MTSDEVCQVYMGQMTRINTDNCIWQRVIHHPGEGDWADTDYPLSDPVKREANMWFATADTSAHDLGDYRAYWTVCFRGANRLKLCWPNRVIRIDAMGDREYVCLADDATLVEARLLEII